MNYVVNREVSKKERKSLCLLCGSQIRINRHELNIMMIKKGIWVHLKKKILEIYKETRNVVRIGEKRSVASWTEKGVRQSCPLSLTLFNLYIADLSEKLRKEIERGLLVGKPKVWSLIYADDITLFAKWEKELKGMINRLGRYVKTKGMELCLKKPKVIVYEKKKFVYLSRKTKWYWSQGWYRDILLWKSRGSSVIFYCFSEIFFLW